jgi:acetyl-CoA C-acetyltransferase
LKTGHRPVTRVENFCASGAEALRAACYAVAAGASDVALAVGVEKLKDSGQAGLTRARNPDDGTTNLLSAPAKFSLVAQAYANRYGLDNEELRGVLTRIAWKNHRNGARNPRAHFQQEVAPEVIEKSPLVAGVLRVHDCSGVSDGAAAAVVVRADEAPRYTSRPLYVKALSLVAGEGDGLLDPAYDFTTFPEAAAAAAAAYREAGIDDPMAVLAVAEVHDCFTPTELVLMEDLGFSARGQAWKDVLDGRFDLDGELAVNADGGLKSFGHPIGASGLRMLFECWSQLCCDLPAERRAAAIERGRTYALMQSLGGEPGDCVAFVGIVGTQLDSVLDSQR